VTSAKSSTVTAAATMATSAATRLRVGCKQASGQRAGYYHTYYPAQHGFFL
jgi:hypothetical protein